MTRLVAGLCAVAGLIVSEAGCQSRSRRDPPRVILISVDTLRADRLNSYGYAVRRISPAIDQLARDGILFENHVAAAPWTTPSHLSLLTGLHPTAHGVTRPFYEQTGRLDAGTGYPSLSKDHVTLAEVFKEHGYKTAAFTGGLTMDGRLGFERGFERYDTRMTKINERRFARLTSWIEAHRDRPFFLFWHTFEVHAPYLHGDFLPEVLEAESAREVRRALAGLAGSSPELGGDRIVARGSQAAESLLVNHGVMTREVCSALYDGGIRSVDQWIGRLVDKLKALGLYDGTLIVVTSDHGEQLGETAGPGGNPQRDGNYYNRHGQTLTEEMVRIPLIFKRPREARAGTRVDAVSRTVDVMPTVLEELGLPIPPQVQGETLRPLGGRSQKDQRDAYSESLSIAAEAKSIRSGRYKYVISIEAEEVAARGRNSIPVRPSLVELYDLVSDPGELDNLMARQRLPEAAVVARLDGLLRRYAGQSKGQAATIKLDAETVEGIRALGYVGQ